MLLTFISLALSAVQQEDPWQTALDEKVPCYSQQVTSFPWYDKAHLLLSSQVCQRALWFDNIFSANRQLSQQSATSIVWLRFENEFHQYSGYSFEPQLNAIVDLPNTEKRLKLLVGDHDDDTNDLTNPVLDSSRSSRSSAVLRYVLPSSANWGVDFDLGFHLSGGPFARTRGRVNHAFNGSTVGKFTQDFVLEFSETWYEQSLFIIDHFNSLGAYRFSSKAKYGAETHGIEWQLAGYQALPLTKRAVTTNFFIIEGATQDSLKRGHSERVRTGIQLRHSVWRPWFFYELEPQLIYPRAQNYRHEWLITFSIELQFGRSRKRGYFK